MSAKHGYVVTMTFEVEAENWEAAAALAASTQFEHLTVCRVRRKYGRTVPINPNQLRALAEKEKPSS